MRRTLFRARVWRPALVRAGLLGAVAQVEPGVWRGTWTDADGVERTADFTTEPDAVAYVAKHAAGGPADFEVRAFVPGLGVPEDPVTGSLNAGIGTWLFGAGIVDAGYTVRHPTGL